MCIRDRLYKVECELLFESVAGNLSFTEEFCRDFLMKDNEMHINFHHKNKSCVFVKDRKCTYNNRYPVSYTHLDVYKRQVLYRYNKLVLINLSTRLSVLPVSAS